MELLKGALRMEGASLTHAFLEREGRARGLTRVLFATERIRQNASSDALLQYRFDPREEKGIALATIGHAAIATDAPTKNSYSVITFGESAQHPWRPRAEVELYDIDISFAGGSAQASERVQMRCRAHEPLRALRLYLSSRLEVSEALLDGEPLVFMQWERISTHANQDEFVVLDLGRTVPAGAEFTLELKAAGPLLEPRGAWHMPSQTSWYPRLHPWSLSRFELRADIPELFEIVSAGTLVSEEIVDKRRRVHYSLAHPVFGTSVAVGNYRTRDFDIGELHASVHMDEVYSPHHWIDEAREELEATLRYYASVFGPLEIPAVREVSAPSTHARGFEGLIFIDGRKMKRLDTDGFLPLAHEVAHQWFGGSVLPRRWPEDRWLMESIAEYAAIQYMYARTGRQIEGTVRALRRRWVDPLYESPQNPVGALDGRKLRRRWAENYPLGLGFGDVYSRGPMLLHMLRYQARHLPSGDEAFWDVLRTFRTRYAGQRAGTDEFVALASEKLGKDMTPFFEQWLWTATLPSLEWTREQTRDGAGWTLRVEARQPEGETPMDLLVPVYVELVDGRSDEMPLTIKNGRGVLKVTLPAEAKTIELNRRWNALVETKEKR